ncbi:MAG: efflux RND transporter periplasmic adaptor subunit [Gammaproteobacteria bacterium]|nr:efflux RND transporter periplasmic adaptor subunit [Gammaproteobacteria bacterium]
MKKRIAIAFIGILIVLAIFAGIKACSIMGMIDAFANYRPPPTTVAASAAKQVQWRPYIEAIGTMEAVNGVHVSSAIAGKVVKIAFQSGEHVEKGALLVQLDASEEKAQLAQFQAQRNLAHGKYQRALAMHKKNLTSDQELDTARASYKGAVAQVAAITATIDKKSINAPFAGVLGIREVNLGQYLSPGTAIVNLVQLRPLFVTFTLPQGAVPELHPGQEVVLTLDAYPGKQFQGEVTAINPSLNHQSRTIEVQATISNQQELLHPGMFVNVRVLAKEAQKQVVIPTTAISYSLYGDTVYVLTPANGTPGNAGKQAAPAATAKAPASGGGEQKVYVAKQVFVKAGTRRDKLVAVSGIDPGTMVVTAGQIKLHQGSRVVINNSIELTKERPLTP